jgi:hypothetical protein
MSTSAIPTQGTKIYVGDTGSPEAFQAIPEVRTIGGPSENRPTRDVTDLDSDAREFKLSLKDAGEVSLGMFYIPANAVHASLRSAFDAGTLKSFRIEFVDSAGTYYDFDAYVISWAPSIEVDSDVTLEIGLKITGDIVVGS